MFELERQFMTSGWDLLVDQRGSSQDAAVQEDLRAGGRGGKSESASGIAAQGKGDLRGQGGHPREDFLERTAARKYALESAGATLDDAQPEGQAVEPTFELSQHEGVGGQKRADAVGQIDEPRHLQTLLLRQIVELAPFDDLDSRLRGERLRKRRWKRLGKERERWLRGRARKVDDADPLRRYDAREQEKEAWRGRA